MDTKNLHTFKKQTEKLDCLTKSHHLCLKKSMSDKSVTAVEDIGKMVMFAHWHQLLLLSLEQDTGTDSVFCLKRYRQKCSFGLICKEHKLGNS